MRLEDIHPFIRFADTFHYTFHRARSQTYDCRLLYILSGSGQAEFEETACTVEPGMAILFQGGTHYRLTPTPAFYAIAVDFDYTDEYAAQTAFFPPLPPEYFDAALLHGNIVFDGYPFLSAPLLLPSLHSLHGAFTELIQEFNAQKIFFREKSSLLLKNILLEIVRQKLSDNKKSQTAEAVLGYLYANYNENIDNTRLGQVFSHDPCYLNRIVKNYTGMSIHRCLMEYRVTLGVKMLMETDLSVEAIAAQTGFYNTAHFSSCCKKLTGNSPSYYRKH